MSEENPTKKELKGTAHTSGDDSLEEQLESATWGEVFNACCVHSAKDWMLIVLGLSFICSLLYFFLFSINLLTTSAKVIGGCTAGSLLGDETNPVASLMIGIMSTAFIQSSSTTSSIVVSLVGAESIGLQQGIFIVMGANMGTSITNTIVSMAQMGDGDEFERAFAGATIHDLFNFLTVAILFPIEVFSGFLYHFTRYITRDPKFREGEKYSGPIKKIVTPLVGKVLKINKSVSKEVAKGGSCSDFYPTYCNGTVSYKNCGGDKEKGGRYGLIGCDKKTGDCPLFFSDGATQRDDEVSGYICMFLAFVGVVGCLIGLVMILKKMLLGASTRVIHKATNINGYIAIVLGAGITMLVQSSSLVTSALTPLVGMDVLKLEQMLPLTLGANLGTTVTALLASLVSSNIDALRTALAHLFFNFIGILIFYPIPSLRYIPIKGAIKLAKATRLWKGFPILYIFCVFLVIPSSLLAISSLFEKDSAASAILGSVIVIILATIAAYTLFWWRCKGGDAKCGSYLQERQAKSDALKTLATDMEYLKAKVAELSGEKPLPEDEVEPLNKVYAVKEELVETPLKYIEDEEIEA
jgi:sodium-dependent phosphate cotransporter